MRRRTFTATASVGAAAAAAAIAAGTLPASAGEHSESKKTDAYTWKNVVINCGGFVPGIVFNETEPNLIYARTDVGGGYRWQEDTRTWKPLLDWVPRAKWGWQYVLSMATDPVEPDGHCLGDVADHRVDAADAGADDASGTPGQRLVGDRVLEPGVAHRLGDDRPREVDIAVVATHLLLWHHRIGVEALDLAGHLARDP